MKGRAMGAALIAMAGRIGAVLGGAPCHWAAAASGNSVMSPMVSRPRITHNLGYSILPNQRGGASRDAPAATLIVKTMSSSSAANLW
jgi:hypothetical protein